MTARPALSGLVPPVVTPLDDTGAVDVASLERVVDHLIGGGVDGLFVLGSSGESVYLSDDQRDTVLKVVVSRTGGQVPVIAGAIEPATGRTIARARAAAAAGVDGIVATAPFYALMGPAEVERHFREVAAATELPLYAYDIPVCVHVKLANPMVVALAADGVLAGVKDSSGDDIGFRQLLLLLADAGVTDFAALTGHETMVDAMLFAGASGSVPGLANVDPAGYARLHAAVAAGDVAAARTEQERLIRLFRIVESADPATAGPATRGVGAFKTALAELGVIANDAVSEPLRRHDPVEKARLRQVLAGAGLL